jgi:hypothetical protein
MEIEVKTIYYECKDHRNRYHLQLFLRNLKHKNFFENSVRCFTGKHTIRREVTQRKISMMLDLKLNFLQNSYILSHFEEILRDPRSQLPIPQVQRATLDYFFPFLGFYSYKIPGSRYNVYALMRK